MITGKTINELSSIEEVYSSLNIPSEYEGYTYKVSFDQLRKGVADYITAVTPSVTATITPTQTSTPKPCEGNCREYSVINNGSSDLTLTYYACNDEILSYIVLPYDAYSFCSKTYPDYAYIPDPNFDFDFEQISITVKDCCNPPTPTPTPTNYCDCRYWFYNNPNAYPISINYIDCSSQLIYETLSGYTTGYTNNCVSGSSVTIGLLPADTTFEINPTGPCCSVPQPTPTPTPTLTPFLPLTGCTGNCYNFIIQNNTCFFIDVNFSGCGTSTTNSTIIAPFGFKTICSSLGPVVVYQPSFSAFQNPYTITQSGCCDCDCVYFDVYISQTDIDNATGNTLNNSFNGVVGIDYVPCGSSSLTSLSFTASGLYQDYVCISTTNSTIHNGNPNNGVSYLNTDYIWLWYRNNNIGYITNTGPFFNPSNTSIVQSYVINTEQCCFAPTPTPTPTPTVTPTITKTPTPTLTPTTTIGITPTPTQFSFCLGQCDLVTYYCFHAVKYSNPITGVLTGSGILSNFLIGWVNNTNTYTIAHTNNKVFKTLNWYVTHIEEYNINSLCSFMGSYNRTITIPSGWTLSDTAYVAKNNTTLIMVKQNMPNQIVEVDVTNNTAVVTVKFNIPSQFYSSGAMCSLVDANSANPKLILGVRMVGSTSKFIMQIDYNSGIMDWVSQSLSANVGGIFTSNGNLYYASPIFNNLSNLYQISTSSPYSETYLSSQPVGVQGISQAPGCAWLYVPPTPTPTVTKTPTPTPTITKTPTPTPTEIR